ncbi:MAG: nuclear transport factor 2 family protein [Gemmatimonadota bacterium]|nr:MAG: nuclear transport factor 2 family protein [Gemmatimonadota bacterium]
MVNVEKEAIKEVIEASYIQGIHGSQDEGTVRRGFHHDFIMFVKQDNTIERVTLDTWFARIEKLKAENPELWSGETTHTFQSVDITGNAAVVKLDVYKRGLHFSTDYMLLYKFEDGWKIVSKIFTIPG